MVGEYTDFTRPGKGDITGSQIAPGAIDLVHFSPALFAEFRQISLHTHSGVKSVQLDQGIALAGSYNQTGVAVRSPNGKIWHIKVDNSGNITAS